MTLDERIDSTFNYFNEIKSHLKETQGKLYNINYDLSEKSYIDFQVYQSFSNYIEDKNNKLENMYKKLNDKYNTIAYMIDVVSNNRGELISLDTREI